MIGVVLPRMAGGSRATLHPSVPGPLSLILQFSPIMTSTGERWDLASFLTHHSAHNPAPASGFRLQPLPTRLMTIEADIRALIRALEPDPQWAEEL